MNFPSTDLSITQAVVDTILGIELDANVPLTPRSNLSTAVAPGDLGATVDDASPFAPGELFSFYDYEGEEPLPIAEDWDGSNQVTFAWNNLDYQGFKYPHIQGRLVGTNLLDFVPNEIDDMVLTEWPLIFVVVQGDKDPLVAQRQTAPIFACHIEYRRILVVPQPAGQREPSRLNTNLWARRAQAQARLEMRAIKRSVLDNPKLVNALGENCQDLGDPTNVSADRFSIQWQKFVTPDNVAHFQAAGDFSVRGFNETFVTPNIGR